MRTPLLIPDHLIREAALYAPTREPLDAVCYVLTDYSRVVADARKMRARLAQIDSEVSLLDDRLHALQVACRAILEL